MYMTYKRGGFSSAFSLQFTWMEYNGEETAIDQEWNKGVCKGGELFS
jgi:hypothetical protein